MKQTFLVISCLLLLSPLSVFSIVNNCHEACGGSSKNDCADFLEETSSPDKCYSCAQGYVGGSGSVDGTGATCKKGTCPKECAACKNETDPNQCYLCSFGFYDSARDPTKATPCSACDKTCSSCTGPSNNQCLQCADGYFDSLSSPYTPGTCDKCASKCSLCSFTRDNCVQGCCAVGFSKENPFSYKCVVDKC